MRRFIKLINLSHKSDQENKETEKKTNYQISNGWSDITADCTDIKRIGKYYEQHNAKNFENIDKNG